MELERALFILIHAVIGSFGTAYVFQYAGRDVSRGGVYGLLVGGMFGWMGLVPLWGWTFLNPSPLRVKNLGRPWYLWWRVW